MVERLVGFREEAVDDIAGWFVVQLDRMARLIPTNDRDRDELLGHLRIGMARLVLDEAYEATLAGSVVNAAATDIRRVFLTLLGGGVFGNPTPWITDTSLSPHDKLVYPH